MDFRYLKDCHAIVYLGDSPGAQLELELARKMGLQVFMAPNLVPHKTRMPWTWYENHEVPRLYSSFRNVQRRDEMLFYERSSFYGESWRKFGPISLLTNLDRKLNALQKGIGNNPLLALDRLKTELTTIHDHGIHEALRDARVLSTMIEAAIREAL